MSEEVKNSSLTVPRQMMLTVVVNGVLGFAITIIYIFAIQDVDVQIAQSTAVYPFIDVFEVATGSQAAAIGMTVPVIILSISMCMNATAAASRQAWSFARDEGLPFSSWLTKIVTVYDTPLPIPAMFASLFIVVILALLNLGGTAAFNSILGLVTGAVGLTYIVSIGCVLHRRLTGTLPRARWSLGRYGVAVNIIALLYETYAVIISFFPITAQVDAKEMNWVGKPRSKTRSFAISACPF